MLPGVGVGPWLVLLVLACLAVCQDQDLCPALYRRYSPRHTFCETPRKSCHVLEAGVSDVDRNVILDVHNMFRSRIARAEEGVRMPSAADMLQIEWNEELAEVAQKLASLCSIKADCSDCRQVEDFTVGQNICNYKVRSKAPPAIFWRSTINFWHEGIKHFPPQLIEPFAYKPYYGTFTQMVWASTWQIGCGYALFTKGSWYVQSYVCNYGPAGNYIGSRMYKPGPACSACPQGTVCSNKTRRSEGPTYQGLCKSTSADGPQLLLPPQTDFFCNFQDPLSKDCMVQEEPYGSFQVRHILGGGYITTAVNGGGQASVTFPRPFTAASSPPASCLRFRFRKGPHSADTGGGSTLRIQLDVRESQSLKTTDITRDYPHWTAYSITLTDPITVLLTLTLKVKPKSPPQYLDITDVLLTRGYC